MRKLNVTRAALAASVSIAALGLAVPAWADATPPCNNGPSGNSTECGENSITVGASSTAVGADAEVTAASGTAVGFDALAAGQALAVGARSEAAIDGTAIGAGAIAASRAVALGRLADAQGANSIALGANSFTSLTETDVVSIGSSLAGSVFQRRLINLAAGIAPTDAVNVAQLDAALLDVREGFVTITGETGSVDAVAGGLNSTAIGATSNAGVSGVAIGSNSTAGSNSTSVGHLSFTANSAVAVGTSARAENFGAIAVGEQSFVAATAASGIALGRLARVEAGALRSIALGDGSVATETNTVSVGSSTGKRRIVNIANGTAVNDAVNVGQLNTKVDPLITDVASLRADINSKVPFLAFDTTSGTVAASATGSAATAVGAFASANADGATSIGRSAGASGTDATSIGFGASAGAANSVAIGANSSTSVANTVSVGRSGFERKIVNVAAGTAPTDAVNVAQLASLAQPFLVINTGSGFTPTAATGVNAVAVGGAANASGLGSVVLGFNTTASGADSVALGSASIAVDPNTVSVGNSGTKRRIVNIGAATQDNDAVNFKQLKDAIATVNLTGGGGGGTSPFFEVNSIGLPADATGNNAIAIGEDARASNFASTAIGARAKAQGLGSVAIGEDANAVSNASVAIGDRSTANAELTVSFGSDVLKRRLVNVGPGLSGTDAVNLDQLNAAISGVATGGPAVDLTPLNNSLAALGATLGVQGTDIATLKTTVGGQATDIANLKTAVANLGTGIGGTGGSVDLTPLNNSVAALEATVGGHTTDITALETTVGGHTTDIAALETTVEGQAVQITALQAKDVALDDLIGGQGDRIDNLENALGNINNTGSVFFALNSDASGVAAVAEGPNAVAIGNGAVAKDGDSVSIGFGNIASGNGAVAIGDPNIVTGQGAVGLGFNNTATGTAAVALGSESVAEGSSAFAQGSAAVAKGVSAIALGEGAQAELVTVTANSTEQFAASNVAIGRAAKATAQTTVAIGSGAEAFDEDATVIGDKSSAGFHGTAIGGEAEADARGAQAFGWQSKATGSLSLVVGHQALASGVRATAVGKSAVANFDGSTALGNTATTTRANQVVLGGAGTSVTLGDIAASTAAQSGPTDVMTVDASGTVGRDTTIRPVLDAVQATVNRQAGQIAALNALSATADGRLTSLEAGQAALFDLANINKKESRRGIAAASALVAAPMPSEPGKTSLVGGTAFYRGEGAFSISFNHRLNLDIPVAFGGGIAHSGGKDTVVRAHVATEF